ncbi:MAG: site-specific DNA-methyltransferase [Candidatus Saccharimonadales bacterium]
MSKSLSEYTKEELLELVQSLKRTKKFGLVWENKPEKVATDCEQKLPVVVEVAERAITKADNAPTNLIIEGDNYHALSVLNYTHAGKIDVIYIDPPYNTGNKDFIYNDRFVDREDGFRHSKWLSFMAKRLKLAKSLLSDMGVIFISIDDNEQANLKLLCDEVFGADNFVANVIWQKIHSTKNDAKHLSNNHEYILFYSKNIENLTVNLVERSEAMNARYKNPDNDPRGSWQSGDLVANEVRTNGNYDVASPITGKAFNVPIGKHWVYSQNTMEQLISDNKIYFGKDGNAFPRKKRFLSEVQQGKKADTIWLSGDVGHNQEGKRELLSAFNNEVSFDSPKPTRLIEYIIKIATDKSATILDFFAGSGTTGHAVLKLNTEDSGERQFILCTNNESGIAENITYARIAKAIDGYGDTEGIPANVRYFKTDFVDKADTTDQTRVALVGRATDMIKIRENTFDKVAESDLYKIYENADIYSVMIFDPSVIEATKAEIAKLSPDKIVHIYIFSLANDDFGSDFADLNRQFQICPIPESVLEVYKRIFGGKK